MSNEANPVIEKRWKGINTLAAIAVIGGLEAYALSKGINGVMLIGAIGVLAGLAGFNAKGLFGQKEPEGSPKKE